MTPALNRSIAYPKRKVRFAPNIGHACALAARIKADVLNC